MLFIIIIIVKLVHFCLYSQTRENKKWERQDILQWSLQVDAGLVEENQQMAAERKSSTDMSWP